MKLIDILVILTISVFLYIAIKTYSRNKGCGCNSKNCSKNNKAIR